MESRCSGLARLRRWVTKPRERHPASRNWAPQTVKILAISDIELPQLQNVPYLRRTYADVSLVISCGDLPAAYIEFVTTVLSRPLFYVRGNHDQSYAWRVPGGDDLHRRRVNYGGLSFVGLEGSRRYNKGDIQYTETEMFFAGLALAPNMLLNRAMWGHGVDVLVTHAPMRGIHDRTDRPHMGFRVFRWLTRLYRPRYFIHGHVDIYDRRDITWTEYFGTQVVNINPVRVLTIDALPRSLLRRRDQSES